MLVAHQMAAARACAARLGRCACGGRYIADLTELVARACARCGHAHVGLTCLWCGREPEEHHG